MERAAEILADPAWCVVRPLSGVDALDAMTSSMARFTDGAVHDVARRIAVDALAHIEPADLRVASRDLAGARLAEGERDASRLTRHVVIAVLAGALGFEERDATGQAVAIIAACLAPVEGATPAPVGVVADAVALLDRCAPGASVVERANVVALLFQAVDATTGLVTNALLSDDPADLEATLRDAPPVVLTRRRLASGDGHDEVVVVRLDAAALPFGAGRHECPGRSHALALATGVIDSVLAAGLCAARSPQWEARSNLRIAAHLALL